MGSVAETGQVSGFRLGIDTSNLRGGGADTHILDVLGAARPEAHGIDKVLVWASAGLCRRLPSRPWLRIVHDTWLDRALPFRRYWQTRILPCLAAKSCDALFVPGGGYRGWFQPVVTMSRNLLPFEAGEMRRYGLGWMFWKLLALRRIQTRSFREAQGVIFLDEYARATVLRTTGCLAARSTIIPHGIDDRFRLAPRVQKPVTEYDSNHPLHLLYVSSVDCYKHQWHVVEAVAELRRRGLPVCLELVGRSRPVALQRLQRVTRQVDPRGEFVRYLGLLPHERLASRYHEADCFVFASSCENLPNILIEAMAAGLPIGCSRNGPMPGILGDAGVYFDPENPEEIANQIEMLLWDPGLRAKLASAAYEKALKYSWDRCAAETFAFIASVCRSSLAKAA